MIDTELLMKLRNEKNKLSGKFEAYSEIADIAIDNTRECIDKHYNSEAEVWLSIATVCNNKRHELVNKLDDLTRQLSEMG